MNSMIGGPLRGLSSLATGSVPNAPPPTARARTATSFVQLEMLIAQIRQSAAIQTERIQAIVDGAILAVEQVQDKRIEILEKGPEVEVSDVIFDMFLGVALSGLGKALVPITESIAKELANTVTWYGRLSNSRTGFQALRFVGRTFDKEGAFASDFGYGKVTARGMASYNKALREVLEQGIGKRLDAAVEQGLKRAEGKGKSLSHEVDLADTDTPGVAILGAAQTYASNHRAAIAMYHAGFETMARVSPDPQTLAGIRDAISLSPLDDPIVAIRDKHKLLFEVIIWVKLFGFDEKTEIKAKGFKPGLTLPGVTPPLMRYWRKRFAHTIEQWMSGLLAQHGGDASRVASDPEAGIDLRLYDDASKPGFQPTFSKAEQGAQESAVFRFMLAISKELSSLNEEGIGSGGVRVTGPPVPKSK
jgi:hypothetical protein